MLLRKSRRWLNIGDSKNVVVYWLDLQVNELDKLYKVVVALYDSRVNILIVTPIDTELGSLSVKATGKLKVRKKNMLCRKRLKTA